MIFYKSFSMENIEPQLPNADMIVDEKVAVMAPNDEILFLRTELPTIFNGERESLSPRRKKHYKAKISFSKKDQLPDTKKGMKKNVKHGDGADLKKIQHRHGENHAIKKSLPGMTQAEKDREAIRRIRKQLDKIGRGRASEGTGRQKVQNVGRHRK